MVSGFESYQGTTSVVLQKEPKKPALAAQIAPQGLKANLL
jgi:hypothetical protein